MRVRVSLLVVVALAALFGALGAASPVFANDRDGTPRCAVVNAGPIHCAATSGIDPESDKCYVIDPAKDDHYHVSSCTGDEYITAYNRGAKGSCGDAAKQNVATLDCDTATVCSGSICDVVKLYVDPAIKAIGALVGVGSVFILVVSAIQYSTSADDPSKVAAARDRVVKSLIVILSMAVFIALLNWLIPGGLSI